MSSIKYKRILLKLSGEVLAGDKGFGHDVKVFEYILEEVKKAKALGAQIGLVIGSGNIYRGRQAKELGIEEVSAHYMGMLSTAINALALEAFFNNHGVESKALSMLCLDNLIEKFVRKNAINYLESGKLLIFACGTGSPYFTTDTGASLKAVEISAEILIKGTSVDGVFDKDPKRYNDAKFFEKISYADVLSKDLKVIDATAIAMCKDNKMPLIIYNMNEKDALKKILLGEKVGTLVEP